MKYKLLPPIYRMPEQGCTACRLGYSRKNICYGTGPGKRSKLVICLEAPGKQEDESGLVLCGRSGNLVNGVLSMLKVDRNDVNIINTIKCRPPENRNPKPDEIEACYSNLKYQIAMLKPKMVVAMGKIALSTLTVHKDLGVKKYHGRNFVYIEDPVVPVLYTFHPSFILRPFGAKYKIYFIKELKTALTYCGLK